MLVGIDCTQSNPNYLIFTNVTSFDKKNPLFLNAGRLSSHRRGQKPHRWEVRQRDKQFWRSSPPKKLTSDEKLSDELVLRKHHNVSSLPVAAITWLLRKLSVIVYLLSVWRHTWARQNDSEHTGLRRAKRTLRYCTCIRLERKNSLENRSSSITNV